MIHGDLGPSRRLVLLLEVADFAFVVIASTPVEAVVDAHPVAEENHRPCGDQEQRCPEKRCDD